MLMEDLEWGHGLRRSQPQPRAPAHTLVPTHATLLALTKVGGIVIVDLPTWFDHEQEKSNASPGYQCEPDKEYFHDGLQGLRHHRLHR
jgi:hypothetical protein